LDKKKGFQQVKRKRKVVAIPKRKKKKKKKKRVWPYVQCEASRKGGLGSGWITKHPPEAQKNRPIWGTKTRHSNTNSPRRVSK
jgi:hypothetical protein